MAAFKYKIKILAGEDYDKTFTYKAGDPTPLVVDLTGYTARLQIRPKAGSTTLYIELTTENGGITLGGAAGTIRLFIDNGATSEITWKAGVYDLELISGSGTVRRLLQGSVSVSPEVTVV